jgi:hypothetical protein
MQRYFAVALACTVYVSLRVLAVPAQSAGGSQGDKVVLKVNKLTSTRTQLPYEYYSMPYCRPEKIMPSAENLGEVLRGDRIENSPFEVGPQSLQCCITRQCMLPRKQCRAARSPSTCSSRCR